MLPTNPSPKNGGLLAVKMLYPFCCWKKHNLVMTVCSQDWWSEQRWHDIMRTCWSMTSQEYIRCFYRCTDVYPPPLSPSRTLALPDAFLLSNMASLYGTPRVWRVCQIPRCVFLELESGCSPSRACVACSVLLCAFDSTPQKCSAPQYVDHVMTWVEDQINKEDIFPTTPGKTKALIEKTCGFGLLFRKKTECSRVCWRTQTDQKHLGHDDKWCRTGTRSSDNDFCPVDRFYEIHK